MFLKSAGSYEGAKDSERDVLTCDENGFAQTKAMPYGIYTVHQTKGWEGRELMPDFDVYIIKDGEVYRYLINNAAFRSYIKIVKMDAETGKTIPYAGAGFQLYRPDGSQITQTFTYPTPTTIDTLYTNDEGYLVTPEKLEYGTGQSQSLYLGKFTVKEIEAPSGMVLNSGMCFPTRQSSSSKRPPKATAARNGNPPQSAGENQSAFTYRKKKGAVCREIPSPRFRVFLAYHYHLR